MMQPNRNGRRTRLLAAAAAAWVLPIASSVNHSHAAALTWVGGTSTNWGDASNWAQLAAPSNGDSVAFSGANTVANNNIANLSLTGIAFNGGAGAFALGGPNGVTLTAAATGTGITQTSDIASYSTNNQTINHSITLNVGRHQFLGSAGALNVAGAITQPVKGSTAVFAPGAGGINLNGSGLANSNGILGGWATIGQDFASLNGAGVVVPYSGYTDVYGGQTLVSNAASNIRIPVSGAAITAPAGVTQINSINFSGYNAAQTLTVGAGNTLVLGQQGGIYNTTLNLGGSTVRNFTIALGTLTAGDGINPANITVTAPPFNNQSGMLTVTSVIADNGAAPVSFTLQGGYVTLGTANTYSGGTYILSGRISQPVGGTFGTGPIHIYPGGMINPGGAGAVTIPNNLFISGYGTAENNGLGAVRMFQNTNGQTTQLSGTVTLVGDSAINSNGLTYTNIVAGRHVAVTGKITGPGAFAVGSPVTNSGNGTGILEIGALTGSATANDYAGDTTVNAQTAGNGAGLRIAQASDNNIMPHGSTGSFAGGATGNLILNANAAARPAIFDLNGSTQTINGLSNTTTSQANNIVQSSNNTFIGTLIVGDSNASSTFGGIIRDADAAANGTLALSKIGNGVLTLSGTATNSGGTTINAGALAANGAVNATAGSITVANGALYGGGSVGTVSLTAAAGPNKATINPGPRGPSSTGTLTTGNVTIGGGSDLQFDAFGPGQVDLLNSTGTVTFSAAGTISPSATLAGTYTVATATGGFSGTAPTLGAGDTRLGYVFNPASWPLVGASTSIIIDATGSVASIVWSGAGGSVWDLHNTSGFINGGADKFYNGDAVLFDNTGSPNFNVSVPGQVAPGSTTFNNGSTYTLSGAGSIAGPGSLTKSGTGIVIMALANSYTGGTVLHAGTLSLNNERALGQPSGTGLTINGGSLGNRSGRAIALAGNPTQQWNGDLAFTGPNDLDMGTGAISSTPLGANRNIIVTAGTLTIGGVITDTSGTSGLMKFGNGTLALNAANFYSGATTILAGTVKVGNFAAFGAINNPNGITVNAGATLDVGGFTAANVANGFGNTPITISGDGAGVGGAGALINSGAQPQNNAFQVVNLATNASVGGPNRLDIRGVSTQLNLNSNTLTKTGPGQFSIAGATVGPGNIVVNGGTLSLEGSTTIPDNADGRSITVNSNGTLQFLTIAGGQIARPINLVGSNITINDAGGSNTIDSPISLQSNITLTGVTTATITLNGNVTESGGPRSINKLGINTLALAGNANNYSGATTIAGGGLILSGAGTIGPVDGASGTTLTKNNAGAFTIGRMRVPTVNLNGNLTIAPHGGAAGVSVVNTFNNGAKLDLTNNHLIVQSPGQTDTIAAQIATGRGTGNFWDGATGIVTSQTQAIGSNYTSIGVAKASDVRPNTATATDTWAGQTITGTDTLVMYTYGGDATLDGKINVDDYIKIDSGIAAGLTGWVNGDFNYDGKVNIDDYTTVIDANIGNQTGTFFTAGGLSSGDGNLSGVSAVPEPVASVLLFVPTMTLLARRRLRAPAD